MPVERLPYPLGPRSFPRTDRQFDVCKLGREKSPDLLDRHGEVGVAVKTVGSQSRQEAHSHRQPLTPLPGLQQPKLGPEDACFTYHLGGSVAAAVVDDDHLGGIGATREIRLELAQTGWQSLLFIQGRNDDREQRLGTLARRPAFWCIHLQPLSITASV
jgi:hypothetical protein